MAGHVATTLREAQPGDRPAIYRLRHEVYATELRQRPENAERMLVDEVDDWNMYLVATRADDLIGFISLTCAGTEKYSFERYFHRTDLPFEVDSGLFEVRLLTLHRDHRILGLVHFLFYGAYQVASRRGATRLVTTGHTRVRPLYRSMGLQTHDLSVKTGALDFQLMSASMSSLESRARALVPSLSRLRQELPLEWSLAEPFE